jgi:hypothetical protein
LGSCAGLNLVRETVHNVPRSIRLSRVRTSEPQREPP